MPKQSVASVIGCSITEQLREKRQAQLLLG